MAASQLHMRRLFLSSSRNHLPRIIPRTRLPVQSRSFSLWNSSKPAATSTSTTPAQDASFAHLSNPDSFSRTIRASDVLPVDQPPASISSSPALETDLIQDDLVGVTKLLKDVPERIGYLKADCGLDFGWGPSAIIETALEYIHIYGGYSWATSIVIMAAVFRLTVSRMMISSADQTARLRSMQVHAKPLQTAANEAKTKGDFGKQREIGQELLALKREYGVKYSKMLLPVVFQIAFGFGAWRVLRNAAELPVPGFVTESWLWTHDLSFKDPLYIVPVVCMALVALTLQQNKNAAVGAAANMVQFQKTLRVVLPVITGVFTAVQPGAFQLYFLTSTTVGLVNAYLLNQNWFRHWYNLPSMEVVHRLAAQPQSPSPDGDTTSSASSVSTTSPSTASQQSPRPGTPRFGGMRIRAFEERDRAAAVARTQEAARLAGLKNAKSLPDKIAGWGKGMAGEFRSESKSTKTGDQARKERNDLLKKRDLDERRKERNRTLGVDQS